MTALEKAERVRALVADRNGNGVPDILEDSGGRVIPGRQVFIDARGASPVVSFVHKLEPSALPRGVPNSQLPRRTKAFLVLAAVVMTAIFAGAALIAYAGYDQRKRKRDALETWNKQNEESQRRPTSPLSTVNYFADASSIRTSFHAIGVAPAFVSSVAVYPERWCADVLVSRERAEFDTRCGTAAGLEPARPTLIPPRPERIDHETLAWASVDLSVLPRIAVDAKTRLALPNGAVTHAVLRRSPAPTPEPPLWRVFVGNDRHRSGSVSYDVQGRMIRVYPP